MDAIQVENQTLHRTIRAMQQATHAAAIISARREAVYAPFVPFPEFALDEDLSQIADMLGACKAVPQYPAVVLSAQVQLNPL